MYEKINNKAIELFQSPKFIDENLINEVSSDYEHKVIDFFSLSLPQIETLLNVKPIQDKEGSNYFECETWYDVVSYMQYIQDLNKDFSTIASVKGYEVTDNNYHDIKLYYTHHVSNS